MYNTSETIMNISAQPEDFCNYIDPAIEKPILLQKELNIAEDFYFKSNLSEFSMVNIIPCINPISKEKFDSLINEMNSWFNGWLILFKTEIDKEESFLFKARLDCEYISIKSIFDIFNYKVEVFKKLEIELIKKIDTCFEEYQNTVKLMEKEKNDETIESYLRTNFSDLNDALELIKDTTTEFIDLYEFLREAASITRNCCNTDLKYKTKIQLTRNKHKEWLAHLNDRHSSKESLSNYSYKSYNEDIATVNKNY